MDVHFVSGTPLLRGIEMGLYSVFNCTFIFIMRMKSFIISIEVSPAEFGRILGGPGT